MLSSLKRRIQVSCVTIIALAMILTTAVSYFTVESHYEKAIEKNLNAVADGNASAIEEWIASRTSMIEAARAPVAGGDPVTALIQLAESGGFLSAYLGKPDGSLMSSDGWVPPADYDPRKRGWYRDALDRDETIVSMPYVDANSGEIVVSFATPVERSGKLVGVIGSDVVIDTVVADIKAIQPTPSSFAFLSMGGETLIAHPNTDLTLKPLSRLNEKLTPSTIAAIGNSSDWQNVVIDGRSKRLAIAPIPGSEWELGVALDEQEATAGLQAIIKSSLITMLVVLIVAATLLGLWL
ncbi:cache domain-containing protein, partial [Halomonas sp. M20]|uniref:cache domain-containing protein n=1 Tax=Halomonas sp. M20 TaxID=2763264 RepID=UPI001D09C9C9